ncbi:hypothetical protein KUCAC02_006771, partial [Chaenocephalus aceratus]
REDVGEKVAEEAESIEAQNDSNWTPAELESHLTASPERESDEEHRGEEEVTVIHVTLIEGNPHPSYVICLFEDARLLPGLFVLDGKEWNLRKSMFETLLSRPEWALKPTFTTFWKMGEEVSPAPCTDCTLPVERSRARVCEKAGVAVKVSAVQSLSVPEPNAAIFRDAGSSTAEETLGSCQDDLPLSPSIPPSVSSPLHVSPALTAYLNHMKSLIWQPSEKLKDVYSRRADWLNLLGAKGGGGGRLQAPTASPSLPGSPKGAAMAM